MEESKAQIKISLVMSEEEDKQALEILRMYLGKKSLSQWFREMVRKEVELIPSEYLAQLKDLIAKQQQQS